MNGETTDADGWRVTFPGLFGDGGRPIRRRERSEAILAVSLAVADRGEQVRSQVRGAIVEALTEVLLGEAGSGSRGSAASGGSCSTASGRDPPVRRDRRAPGAAEAYDCKWGARGINADVLHQLDDARTHAADEDERLEVALVVFDAARSCAVRLDRQTAPTEGTRLIAIETLDELAGAPR